MFFLLLSLLLLFRRLNCFCSDREEKEKRYTSLFQKRKPLREQKEAQNRRQNTRIKSLYLLYSLEHSFGTPHHHRVSNGKKKKEGSSDS